MIGQGDREATRDPASVFEIRVHSSNNIYRIYISCIYLYTYRKRYSPNKTNKQKIQVQLTTKNAIMQEGKKQTEKSSAGKRCIIVLFTDVPGLLLPSYKNTIPFF